jgi:hypothetical protein
MINNNTMAHVTNFNHLGCPLGSNRNNILQNKLQRFIYLCGTSKHTLPTTSQQKITLIFYNVSAVPSLLHGSECWTSTTSPTN